MKIFSNQFRVAYCRSQETAGKLASWQAGELARWQAGKSSAFRAF
jgi:hypothetical protein